MSDIKAAFFDVDGTLVSFKTHRMSPATVEALWALRARGVKLFLSTGRSPVMLSCVRDVFPFDGWIAFNGQLCKYGDRFVRRVPLERETTVNLVNAIRAMDLACVFMEQEDIYFNRSDPRTAKFLRDDLQLPLPPVRGLQPALEGDLFQCITCIGEKDEPRFLGLVPHLNSARWHPDFMDAIPAGGGKDKGMTAVLDALGIPPEETIAFGDGGNDLPMLNKAGISVAMGNATDDVKARADYIAPSVDEDGVAAALRHFALI